MMDDDRGFSGDQLREQAQTLFEQVRDVFRRSADEIVTGARITRNRIDIYQLRRDRDRLLVELGEVAYELIMAGELSHRDLDLSFEQVRAIEERIRDYEDDIATTSREAGWEDVQGPAEAAAPEPVPQDEPVVEATTPAAAEAAEEKAAKKTAAKKAPAKKAPAKKTPAKKAPAKKTAAKKTTAGKTTARKTSKSTGRSTKKKSL